jgi:hypothetical protein
MATRPCSLSVENLESRLNLSTLGAAVLPAYHDIPTRAEERSVMNERKIVRSLAEYTVSAKQSRKDRKGKR